ncbi:metallophosphoesterase [Gemmatimonadota bacterium]
MPKPLTFFLPRRPVYILSAALLGMLSFSCARIGEKRPVRFLAITDTHISADSDMGRWRAFLHSVRDRDAEFMIVLGDVTGHAPEYLEPVREIAEASDVQVYFLPGNHDDNYARDPEWWTSVFPGMYYAFEHRGRHFIMNWSTDSTASLAWLAACLDSIPSGEPIIICQHHPPKWSWATDGGPWPLLSTRAEDIVVGLGGHHHNRRSDTLGTILFETLGECSMDSTLAGYFYEITLTGDDKYIIDEFPLNELALSSPEDSPPYVRTEDTSGYFVVENALELRGSAWDDRAVSLVEWRLDEWAWRRCKGTDSWSLSTPELSPGHHQLWIRARDNAGQASLGFERALVYVPGPEPPENVVVIRQGVDGYNRCKDVTVRGHRPDSRGSEWDLECWIYGEQAEQEFSEIYISFDLSGIRKPRAGSRVKGVRLVFHCCRQNKLSPAQGDDLYRVAAVGGPWSESMNYLERPESPGWHPVEDKGPEAVMQGEWPFPDSRQELRPPLPVTVDLSTFARTVESWMAHPEKNYGWVISPLYGQYNISFCPGEHPIPTLRPKLEITFE